jgi:diguanylate cyclase (GGDEF)-like protein
MSEDLNPMKEATHGFCSAPFDESFDGLKGLMDLLSRFHSDYLSNIAAFERFERMLSGLISHTGSSYGFVAKRVECTGDDRLILKILSLHSPAVEPMREQYVDGDIQNIDTSHDSLISSLFRDGIPVISSDMATDPRAKTPLPGEPAINTFLSLPIRVGGDTQGILALGGRQGGYDQAILQHLTLVANTLATLMMAEQRPDSHFIDPLTGLISLQAFSTRFAIEASRHSRKRLPLSLLHIEIDHFNNYKKHHGETATKICLKQVAKILASNLRTEDCVVHLRDGRFAALLSETPGIRAVVVAEKLRQSICIKPIEIDELGTTLSPTISIGLTTLTVGGTPLEELSSAADHALSSARHQGGNQVQASSQRF